MGEISKQREKQLQKNESRLTEEVIEKLTEAINLRDMGDEKGADAIRSELVKSLKKRIENTKQEELQKNSALEEYLKLLPDRGRILSKDDMVILTTISEDDKNNCIRVSREHSSFKGMYADETFIKNLWEEFMKDTAVYFMISDVVTGEFIGYCGIKDISCKRLEIVIELLNECKQKRYGTHALTIMLSELSKRTKVNVYRSRVEIDNYASQALMKKIGARPDGISEFLLHGEDLAKFQEENEACIDDKLRAVAEEFQTDPKELIGHVLECRIDWKEA